MNTKNQSTGVNADNQMPESKLERILIKSFLLDKGFTAEKISELSEEERKKLMTEASQFASIKLAEVETRAKLIREIHDASDSVTT